MDQPFSTAHIQIEYNPYRDIFRAGTKNAALFSYVVAVLGLAINLSAGIILGFDFLLIFLSLVFAAILFMRIASDWWLPRSFYQKALRRYPSGLTVELFEQSVRTLVKEGSASSYLYEDLSRAIRTNEGFLFSLRDHAIFLSNHTLEPDVRQHLGDILQEKLGERYRARTDS